MRMSPLLFSSILLLSAATAYSADNPTYNDGVLTLPSVDTASQVGQYQNVTFQLTPQGSWTLTDLQVLDAGNIYPVAVISNVEVIKTDAFPVSVYLQVSGEERSCGITGPARFHQRRQERHFDIDFSAPHSKPRPSGPTVIVCTAHIHTFRQTVPLQVYGLSAGTYSYNLNGTISGTFTLDRDNKFPNDCDVVLGGACPVAGQ